MPDPDDSNERMAESDAIISFLRHEVTFNNKKSIVINVRDLTAQECLFESQAKIKQLNKVVERLSDELEHPLSTVNKSANLLAKNFGKAVVLPPIILKYFNDIQNYSMLSSIKAKNFKDFAKLSTSRLKANLG